MEYQVNLETFRGPLDLLLFLVRRHEIDVYDIPIAQVTEQFLDYLHVIDSINVEHAGDFLVMAATLMEIKSRLLLPQTSDDADKDTDPRQELVKQLLEYKKFKDAAALLEAQAERQLNRVARAARVEQESVEPAQQPLQAVELWDLVSAFGRLMRETLALQPQQIIVDDVPIHVYQHEILLKLELESQIPFTSIFTGPRTRARLIGLFLALLELIRSARIIASQNAAFDEIWVARREAVIRSDTENAE